jgi:site-specific DNA recombinase
LCEAQFKMCLTLVNSMRSQGWELVDASYDDVAESSETLNRPAILRLLDEIAHRRIDRVIVTRLDRISRRLQDSCEFMESLRKSNVAITIASQPEIGGDAQGRLLINLMASFAQFEQDMTRSRMEEARDALKLHGRRVAGRVAYGYSADPITKQLVPSKATPEINTSKPKHVNLIDPMLGSVSKLLPAH